MEIMQKSLFLIKLIDYLQLRIEDYTEHDLWNRSI